MVYSNAGYRPTWRYDAKGRLILLDIPSSVDLDRSIQLARNGANPDSVSTSLHSSVPLLSLPTELVHRVVACLHPIERVCLALTSKAICSSILSAPRIPPSQFAEYWPPPRKQYHVKGAPVDVSVPPEYHGLLLRLAIGWLDKRHWRYCGTCGRILRRDQDMWRKKLSLTWSAWLKGIVCQGKLCNRRMPAWTEHLAVRREAWEAMSWTQRGEMMVKKWCTSSRPSPTCYGAGGSSNASIPSSDIEARSCALRGRAGFRCSSRSLRQRSIDSCDALPSRTIPAPYNAGASVIGVSVVAEGPLTSNERTELTNNHLPPQGHQDTLIGECEDVSVPCPLCSCTFECPLCNFAVQRPGKLELMQQRWRRKGRWGRGAARWLLGPLKSARDVLLRAWEGVWLGVRLVLGRGVVRSCGREGCGV